jgi:hypothetical protein
MLTRHRGRLGALTGVAVAALLALPAAAFANTSAPIAQTGGMTATLPLLGSSLKVEVTLDSVGNVSAVNLDPVGTFSATSVDAHAVTFENTDGTAQVKIKAKGDKMSIGAKAGSLADLLGSGTWTADVFGTGEQTTVNYTIGDAGGGVPTVSIDSVSAPSAVTATTNPTKTSSDEDEQRATASVTFVLNGFTKRLSITVKVDTGTDAESDGDHDDGATETPSASLKITLTGKDRQTLTGTLDQLAAGGPYTWNGMFCDGSAVAAGFQVGTDGTVSFLTASAGTPKTRTLGHGVLVRFEGTKVSVMAKLVPQGGDQWRLDIKGKTGRCGKHDGQLPAVNTPLNIKQPTETQQWRGATWSGSYDGGSGDGSSWGSGSDGHS